MLGLRMNRIWNGMIFTVVMLFYFKSILVLVSFMYLSDVLIKNRHLKMLIIRKTKRVWLNMTMAALHIYFPQPIFIHYNPIILQKAKNIVISNHLTEYDWLFILTLLYHLERFDDVCIILKQSLRQIPLIGYGMQYFGFIFLNRKLDKDKEIINEGVSRLTKKNKYDLLVFPEGTYIDSCSYPKSKKFSEDNDIKVDRKPFSPTNVLIPRTSGFNILKEEILEDIDGVIDITMVLLPYHHYPQEVYSYTDTILDFRRQMSFSFYIDFVSNKKVIDDPNFLYNTFKQKDNLLEKYKNSFGERSFKNLEEFKSSTAKLGYERENYFYKSINMKTKWSAFFYTSFIMSEILFAYSFYKIFRYFVI